MAGKQSSGGLWAINHWLKPACAQTQLHPVCLESQQKASRKAVVVVFGHFFGKLQILLLAFPTLLKNTTNTQTCQRPLGFLKGSWSVCVCVRESYLCWLQVFVISFRRKPHSLQGETECQLLSPTCVCVFVSVLTSETCVCYLHRHVVDVQTEGNPLVKSQLRLSCSVDVHCFFWLDKAFLVVDARLDHAITNGLKETHKATLGVSHPLVHGLFPVRPLPVRNCT